MPLDEDAADRPTPRGAPLVVLTLHHRPDWLAATYAPPGQPEQARAEVAEVQRIQSNYAITGTAGRTKPFKSAQDGEHMLEEAARGGATE